MLRIATPTLAFGALLAIAPSVVAAEYVRSSSGATFQTQTQFVDTQDLMPGVMVSMGGASGSFGESTVYTSTKIAAFAGDFCEIDLPEHGLTQGVKLFYRQIAIVTRYANGDVLREAIQNNQPNQDNSSWVCADYQFGTGVVDYELHTGPVGGTGRFANASTNATGLVTRGRGLVMQLTPTGAAAFASFESVTKGTLSLNGQTP